MSAAEISARIYASFADLPREIYDEIVDICLALGSTPLLRKCTAVHTALLPRVYTYLFANISFYSCTGEAAVHKRNERISTFLSILRWRPYVACIIRSVTLYLHEDNDWLVEETGFLSVMQTLKDLGAHPTKLCLYKLPGIDYIRLPTHPKFETEVIRPVLSSSVKHLTIRNCKDLQHNFLSIFTGLEEIILDRISLSAATYACQSLTRAKYARIDRLEIRRCLHNEGIFALLNPWCGLPFDFSALRELQCSVETMTELASVYHVLAPNGTTTLQELRLIIDVASNNGRWMLGRLTFSDIPSGIAHLRLTLLFKGKLNPGLDYYQPLVDSLSTFVSSGDHSATTRLTVDLPHDWVYGCYIEGVHETRWGAFVKQIELWRNNLRSSESRHKSRQRTDLDLRLNFVATSTLRHSHRFDPQSIIQDAIECPILQPYFPGWYTFEYGSSTSRWSEDVAFKYNIRYSAHLIWPHPLEPSELHFRSIE